MQRGYDALSQSEMEIFQLAAKDMEERVFDVDCLERPDGQTMCCMCCISDEQHAAVLEALGFARQHRDKGFKTVLLYTFHSDHDAETHGYETGTFYVFATNLPTQSGNEVMVPFTDNVRNGLDPAIVNHASEQLLPWSTFRFINSVDPAATLVAQSAIAVTALLLIWGDLWVALWSPVPLIIAGLYYYRMIHAAREQYTKDFARTAEVIRTLRTEPDKLEPRMHLVGV